MPSAAIQCVKVLSFAREYADWIAAANHLSIGSKIGANPVVFLRAAQSNAEAGDHFVEDQRGSALRRDFAQFMQKFPRLHLRVTALDGLDHHCGNLIAMCAEELQRRLRAVLQHHCVVRAARHDAGSDGRGAVRRGAQQNLVEGAVIVAGEVYNLVARGHRTGHAQRRHHRLGTGVAKSGALHARQFADHFRNFSGQRTLRTNLHSSVDLLVYRFIHKLRAMAEHDRAESIDDVDVLVAVDIPDARAFGAAGYQRVDHLFPQ